MKRLRLFFYFWIRMTPIKGQSRWLKFSPDGIRHTWQLAGFLAGKEDS